MRVRFHDARLAGIQAQLEAEPASTMSLHPSLAWAERRHVHVFTMCTWIIWPDEWRREWVHGSPDR